MTHDPTDRLKIINLGERFEHTGEPTVQPVVLWGLRGKPCFEKVSAELQGSPALEYARSIEPVPGKTISLIIGLGSFEFYGLNRNGDGFNEQPYRVGQQPTCGCCTDKTRTAWIEEAECTTHHYQSYENGAVFRHHVNKDRKKAVGHILKAFWNPIMHRVEVIEDLNNAKAPDLATRIGDGEFPAKSMGCRIKFDVCTKCGHRAPTRKQYCDHLKWEMGHLDQATGIRYGALNPAPNFFDSSWVFRPADRTGWMLKKVAEHAYELQGSSILGERVEDLNHKAAAAQKLAVIDKIVQGYPAAAFPDDADAPLIERFCQTTLPTMVENTEELTTEDMSQLNPTDDIADVLASLAEEGITLTTPEFIRLFVSRMAPGVEVPPAIMPYAVILQSELFDLLRQHPSLVEEVVTPLTKEKPQRIKIPEPILEKRSFIGEYLQRRLAPTMLQGNAAPTTDLLHVLPSQGQDGFKTTRGAAQGTQDAIAEAKLKQGVVAGLLSSVGLGVAGLVAKKAPGAQKWLALAPLAGGLGLGGYYGAEALRPVKMRRTTEGGLIPARTPMKEYPRADVEESALMEATKRSGLSHRVKSGSVIAHLRKYSAAQHPMALFVTKHASHGAQCSHLSLAAIAHALEKRASAGIFEEPIDLDKVADLVGCLIWA